MKYFKKYDIIIYSVILIIFLIFFYKISKINKIESRYIEIYEKGKLKYKYSLIKDRREIEIDSKVGKEILVIENNTVYKIKASCSNKNCIKQGKIKNTGDMIICIPNEQVIKISGEEEYDFIIK